VGSLIDTKISEKKKKNLNTNNEKPDSLEQGNIEYLSDVQETNILERAKEKGLLEGNESVSFKLDDTITRSEMAKLITLYVKQYEKKNNKNFNCDIFLEKNLFDEEVQDYFLSSCQRGSKGYDITGFKINQNFDPYKRVTKAEVVAITSKLLRGTVYDGTGTEMMKEISSQNHGNPSISSENSLLSSNSRNEVYLLFQQILNT